MVRDHPFTENPNLSSLRTGHINLGNSFLALLSGPPSLLQSDFRELPYSKLMSDTNSIVVNTVGSGIPLTNSGLPSEYPSEQNLQCGTDFCSSISTRAVEGSNCTSNSVLPGLQSQCSETTAIHCMVPENEKAKGSFSSSREWHSTVALNAGRVSSTKVHATQLKCLEASHPFSIQSLNFLSDCPRVFCSGTG